MTPTLRFASTPEDREAVYRLRYDVYVEELGHSFELPAGDERLPDPPARPSRLLMAEAEGALLGTLAFDWGGDRGFDAETSQTYRLAEFLAVLPPAGLLVFHRFLTTPEARLGPAPELLLEGLLRFALEQGVRAIFCDCRPHLLNAYLRLGFRPFAPTASNPIAGLLVPLVLLLDDHQHLARLRARFALVARSRSSDPLLLARLAALLPDSSAVRTLAAGTADWPALATALGRQAELFEGLDAGEVAQLLDQGSIIDCGPGQPVVRQGVTDRTVFLLLEGLAEVWRDGATVGIVGPGGTFGEVALLTGRPRTADVIAATQCRVLALRAKTLAALVEGQSTLAAKLLRNLATGLAEKLAAER